MQKTNSPNSDLLKTGQRQAAEYEKQKNFGEAAKKYEIIAMEYETCGELLLSAEYYRNSARNYKKQKYHTKVSELLTKADGIEGKHTNYQPPQSLPDPMDLENDGFIKKILKNKRVQVIAIITIMVFIAAIFLVDMGKREYVGLVGYVLMITAYLMQLLKNI